MSAVDPQLYFDAAAKLIDASLHIETQLRDLDKSLAVSRSAGVHSSAGSAWATSYDQSASDVFEIGSLSAMAARELGFSVHQAGDNHAQAENAASPQNPPETVPPPPAGSTLDSSLHPSRMAVGGAGDFPQYWDLIADKVHKQWPDCDPPRITTAGNNFDRFGTIVIDESLALYNAVTGIFAGEDSPEINGILDEVGNLSYSYRDTGNLAKYLKVAADSVSAVSSDDRDTVSYMLLCLKLSLLTLESAKIGALRLGPISRLIEGPIDAMIEEYTVRAAADFDNLMTGLDIIVTKACTSNAGVYDIATSSSRLLTPIMERTPRQTDPLRNRDGDANREAGDEGERRAGIDLNEPKEVITVDGRNRIPDLINRPLYQITEVKNKNQLTSADDAQISDMAKWASENGYTMTVVTDHRTLLDPTVQKMIDDGQITIIRKELDDGNDL